MDNNLSEQMLDQLNQFTRRKHTAEEVYLFDLILCDNEIDRDGDCFTEDALAEMQKRFVGVTGIFDHDPHAGNQTARIFRTALCTDSTRTTKAGKPYQYLKANAYMVRTERNADLIREIEAGIKKEVSVSVAVTRQICSVCGANRIEQPCSHLKGKQYGGKRCYALLDGISDVYEWSFVAVPAQRGAGVTKTLGGSGDSEKQTLRRLLEQTAAQLDEVTEVIRRDVVRLCWQQESETSAKLLAETAVHLNLQELLALQKSLQMRLSPSAAPAQLSGAAPASAAPQYSAYRMNAAEKE